MHISYHQYCAENLSLPGIHAVLFCQWNEGKTEEPKERGHSYLIGIGSAFVFNKEVCFVCILSLSLSAIVPLSVFFFFPLHLT